MNFEGIIIGIGAFLIIGILHPVVIKAEYYIGKRIWPVFLIGGFFFIVLSLFIESVIITALIGVLGFSLLWGIHELFKQEERVKKGWYPKNMRRQ
ncbi:MAG: DUF4491 family protein [Methanobacteriaceae archaeon]|jgi:lipopolysaccharide export LptBFGC system permease protein LptF|nr:DUF4491 family protein [Methanobacteriaceae archaeon]OPY24159.1 MAG: hypothetical protein A4E26_00457 [Methanobacterium sp. PtaU1.Bin097]